MGLEGKWIKIQSYKHDGTLHRLWRRNFVLVDDDNWLIVASKKTKVIEGNGRVWFTKEPAVSFFSKNSWFNTIAMFKTTGITFYCNIASPTLIDGDVAKYVDYDLDIKRLPDHALKILDRNEFKKNISVYKYPPNLVQIIYTATAKVEKMVTDEEYPFDEKIVRELFSEFAEFIK